jgi:hypothetical protein
MHLSEKGKKRIQEVITKWVNKRKIARLVALKNSKNMGKLPAFPKLHPFLPHK